MPNPFNPGAASQFSNLFYFPSSPPTTSYGSNPQFQLNPGARSGAGAFGAVPGAIGLPSPYSDLSSVFPNLSRTNAGVSNDILSKLSGTLSPSTQSAIKDAGAAWGVSSGVPGSGIQTNRSLRDIGLASEQQQQQGLADYASLIPTISSTQTVAPGLQAEISATNAMNAAAPDPTQSANFATELFNRYLNMMKGRGGPGSGTGVDSRTALATGGPPMGMVGAEMAPVNWWQQLMGLMTG